jgi:hypothetical protein
VAAASEAKAFARCAATTKRGSTRRAACVGRARRTYARAIAVTRCRSIRSAHARATCVARARRVA